MRRARKFFGTGTSPGLGARRRQDLLADNVVYEPVGAPRGRKGGRHGFASRFGGDAANRNFTSTTSSPTNTAALNASLLMPGGRVEYCRLLVQRVRQERQAETHYRAIA